MDNDPKRQATLARLAALSPKNYRRTRWEALDAARSLEPPIEWAEIGEALGVTRSSAHRMYQDVPE